MNKIIGALAIALTLFLSANSSADRESVPQKSSFSTDESDLWWNPNESGWGMQVVQQADILFATLFVYASNGDPTWFSATLVSTGPLIWSGDLYRTTGPFFGGTFNPTQVGYRRVGTITFNAPLVNSGTVQYSVDGALVTKSIQRQLLKYDSYNGNFVSAVNLVQSSCFNPSNNGAFSGALDLAISQSGTVMAQSWLFPAGETCSYQGSYSQAGRIGQFDGTYHCSTGEVGTMRFFEMTVRIGIISGRISGHSNTLGCQYTGRFTGLIPL